MSKNTKTKKLKKAIEEFEQQSKFDLATHLNSLNSKQQKIEHLVMLISATNNEKKAAKENTALIVSARIRRDMAINALYNLTKIEG